MLGYLYGKRFDSKTAWAMAHPDTRPISFTYGAVVSMLVVTLHYLLCTGTHPYPLTLLLLTQAIFEPAFSLWTPQHFSNLVLLHLPAYEDGTECSETSAYKI